MRAAQFGALQQPFVGEQLAESEALGPRPGGRLRVASGHSAAQKLEHLIGLDRCYEILSWGSIAEQLDPLRRSMQMQVFRILLPITIKAALDGSLDRELARERNRAAVLEALARDLRAGDKAQDEVRG